MSQVLDALNTFQRNVTAAGDSNGVRTDGFSVTQVNSLKLATEICGALSLIGSVCIIGVFVFYPRYRNSTTKLTVLMAFADLLSIIAKVLGRAGPNAGVNSVLCQGQAFLMQWGDIASLLLTAIMALNVFIVIQRKESTTFVSRWYVFYALFAFVPTFFGALVPIFVSTPTQGRMYGDADVWCWVTSEYKLLQLFMFFVPMAIIFVFNIVVYVCTGRRIWLESKAPTMYSSEKKNALHAYRTIYAKNVSIYLLAYFITWTPSLINRLYEFTHSEKEPFVLALLMSIFSPLRGFTYACAFAYSTIFVNLAAQKARNNRVPEGVNNTIKSFYGGDEAKDNKIDLDRDDDSTLAPDMSEYNPKYRYSVSEYSPEYYSHKRSNTQSTLPTPPSLSVPPSSHYDTSREKKAKAVERWYQKHDVGSEEIVLAKPSQEIYRPQQIVEDARNSPISSRHDQQTYGRSNGHGDRFIQPHSRSRSDDTVGSYYSDAYSHGYTQSPDQIDDTRSSYFQSRYFSNGVDSLPAGLKSPAWDVQDQGFERHAERRSEYEGTSWEEEEEVQRHQRLEQERRWRR